MEIEKAIDKEGQEMIEVSQNGSVIGRIYPHPEGIRIEVSQNGSVIGRIYPLPEGIRIVSEYLDGVQHEAVMPPTVVVKFSGPL